MKLFVPFGKIDAAKREVYGIATQEVPDGTDEIFDLESSWPYFAEWSENAEKATSGVSKGNLREMHQLIAAGRLIQMDRDDATKSIRIGAKIVNDDTWKKVDERVLIGFSIGGSYLKKWKDPSNKAMTRFTARPSEISVVDLPCVPTALIDSIKSSSCELVKADGTTESIKLYREEAMATSINELDTKVTDFGSKLDKVWTTLQDLKKDGGKTKRVAGEDLPSSAFAYVGDSNDTGTWKLPIKFSSEEKTKRHIRNALARFNQTQGIPDGEKAKVKAKIVAAAKKHGIDVGDEEQKAQADFDMLKSLVQAATERVGLFKSADVAKSLSNICDLVGVLQALKWVYQDSMWEGEFEYGEGDERDIAISVEVSAAIDHIVEILHAVVDDETSELTNVRKALAAAEKEVAMKLEDLTKAASSLESHFKKAAGLHEKKAELHKALAEHHVAKAAEHKAMMDQGLEEVKGIHKSLHDTHKAKASHHEEVAKVHKAYADHLNKMSEVCAEKAADADLLKAQAEKEAAEKAALEKAAAGKAAEEKATADKAAAEKAAADKAAQEAAAKAAAGKENSMNPEEMKKAIQDAVQAAVEPLQKEMEALKAAAVTPATPAPAINLIPRATKAAGATEQLRNTDDAGF